jgi:hypothetical protein
VTYLSTFREYLQTRTDAPKDFHTHAGLCTLAVALGNHVWFDGPAGNIYPNLHSVILAPSGMGKSVPLAMASIVLRKAGLGEAILPGSFSREAILSQLSAHPVGIFVLQEFAAFMTLLARDYNHGAREDLTTLYDGDDLQRKLTQNSFKIERPALTLLGASSPEWFAQAFKGADLRGGYLARFLFCPSVNAGEPIGYPGPRDDAIEAVLSGHLQTIGSLTGVMDMRDCRDVYDTYAKAARLRARTADPDIAGMRSRAPTMAAKVAMLFHVSREASLRVSEGDMRSAIKFVEYTQDRAEDYLTEEVANDKQDGDRRRILEIVRGQNNRCSWSYALKRSKQDAAYFARNVDTLRESDQLIIEAGGAGERGRFLSIPQFPVNSRELGNRTNGTTPKLLATAS